MNILLTGAAGQLGTELAPLLSRHGKLFQTDRRNAENISKSWVELDVCNAGKFEVLLNRIRPELIINTVAYTAVDQAENDSATAFAVNSELPDRLSHWVQRHDARLIHYSTDYVFNGRANEPYRETDIADPQNVYGASKLAGEQAIQSSGCIHTILRTSWVYSSHGKNFVLSMLDLARKGLALKVVDDQRGCPTWARNLALVSHKVINSWKNSGHGEHQGIFHYCDDRCLNWFEFAQLVFKFAVAASLLEHPPDLTPVPGSEFPQPARRPQWSVLDTQRIGQAFDIQPASFESSLHTVIAEIVEKDM